MLLSFHICNLYIFFKAGSMSTISFCPGGPAGFNHYEKRVLNLGGYKIIRRFFRASQMEKPKTPNPFLHIFFANLVFRKRGFSSLVFGKNLSVFGSDP